MKVQRYDNKDEVIKQVVRHSQKQMKKKIAIFLVNIHNFYDFFFTKGLQIKFINGFFLLIQLNCVKT